MSTDRTREEKLRSLGGVLVLLFVLVKIVGLVIFIAVSEYGWEPFG